MTRNKDALRQKLPRRMRDASAGIRKKFGDGAWHCDLLDEGATEIESLRARVADLERQLTVCRDESFERERLWV